MTYIDIYNEYLSETKNELASAILTLADVLGDKGCGNNPFQLEISGPENNSIQIDATTNVVTDE